MDTTAWLHDKFVPHVKKFCEQNAVEFKIVLLLDNAPSTETLKSTGGEVTTMFLPLNTTSILQPMDQGSTEEKVQEEPFTAPFQFQKLLRK